MLILGIETSCDETAASLVEVYPIKSGKAGTAKRLFDGVKVLSNVVSSQVKLHAKYGGVVPSLAAREHVKNLPKVLKLALKPVTCNLKPIDLIAITRGPGLISSLLVGTTFAKTLAWKYNKPIVGVNHLEGHIASNWLAPVGEISNFQFPISKKIPNSKQEKTCNLKPVTCNLYPAMCLIVSGGHTELVLMTDIGKYKIIGQTLDDAAGEAFDKIARILGLGYPGGPAIAATAAKLVASNWSLVISKNTQPATSSQQPATRLPRPMLKSKDFNFSFAGLKTAVLYLVRDLTKLSELNSDNYQSSTLIINPQIKSMIAAEAQQAIVDVLVSKTIRAAEKYKAKSIMLSGGVSANKLLRSNLNKAAESRGIKFFKPEMEYTTDNAAMIALAGYFNFTETKRKTPHHFETAQSGGGQADWKSAKVDANLTI